MTEQEIHIFNLKYDRESSEHFNFHLIEIEWKFNRNQNENKLAGFFVGFISDPRHLAPNIGPQ
jgi:hypothetical protein